MTGALASCGARPPKQPRRRKVLSMCLWRSQFGLGFPVSTCLSHYNVAPFTWLPFKFKPNIHFSSRNRMKHIACRVCLNNRAFLMGRPNIRPTLAIGLSAYRAYRGHYPAATHWQMPKPKPRPSGTSSDLQWSIPEKPSAVAQNTKKQNNIGHRGPVVFQGPAKTQGPF